LPGGVESGLGQLNHNAGKTRRGLGTYRIPSYSFFARPYEFTEKPVNKDLGEPINNFIE
jgi:hypothetical protein